MKIKLKPKAPSLATFLGEGPALIGAYLEEQQTLTAVDRFSGMHDLMQDGFPGKPKLESHYRDLLPLDKPKPGQQYAFEVDLDRCTGCKACVTACHNLNGLDEDETWRSVGLIHNVIGKPLQQTVTTACQHCLEPACSHGCPVKAYEKDPVTGIVKHLDDQCIGCEYCILKCPYDVPQYHKGKGIVRKCDMCVGRLEVGEAPACVQACPTKAIKITLVEVGEVRRNHANYAAIPGAPDSSYTLPTTRYKTARRFPAGMEAADAYKVKKEKPHYPLVVMLTLSQLAAGFILATEAGSLAGLLPLHPLFQIIARSLGAFLMTVAIVVSITHLGRPLYAFRAVIGFRRSWLSREIVAFGLLQALAAAAATVSLMGALPAGFLARLSLPPDLMGHLIDAASSPASRLVLCLAAVLGVHCSAMVYRDTPRALWASRITSAKFLLTAALTGAAAMLTLVTAWVLAHVGSAGAFKDLALYLTAALPVALIAKLGCEARVHRHLDDQDPTPLKKAALLLRGELRLANVIRFNLGLLGGFLMPILWLNHGFAGTGADLAFALACFIPLLLGELAERYLFFTACVPPRMPGA